MLLCVNIGWHCVPVFWHRVSRSIFFGTEFHGVLILIFSVLFCVNIRWHCVPVFLHRVSRSIFWAQSFAEFWFFPRDSVKILGGTVCLFFWHRVSRSFYFNFLSVILCKYRVALCACFFGTEFHGVLILIFSVLFCVNIGWHFVPVFLHGVSRSIFFGTEFHGVLILIFSVLFCVNIGWHFVPVFLAQSFTEF